MDNANALRRLDSYVFPIATADQTAQGEYSYTGLIGTGFVISSNGWCLTARHVIDCIHSIPCALFPNGTEFRAFDLADIESHPREDLALFRLPAKQIPELAKWRMGYCHAPRDILTMGYPSQLLKDHGRPSGPRQVVLDRPELIVSKGHIRRRFSHSVPGHYGNNFAEINEWLGEGSSGGPVLDQATSTLIGVYLGYRIDTVSTADGDIKPSVARGLILRLDDCTDWIPKVLGSTLGELLTMAN